jgi:uncharacterized protein YdhG (YjbR/CyaY superfamily)
MQRNAANPSDYIGMVPAAQRPLLDHLRALIVEAGPRLQEGLRWGMLCYEDTGALFALAAQKHHVALYVMATQALRDFDAQLAGVDHGKGCLRFRTLAAVPTETLRGLLAHATSLRERECRDQRAR